MAKKTKPKCATCRDQKRITVRKPLPSFEPCDPNSIEIFIPLELEQRDCPDCATFIVVHGHKNFDLCSKARVAFEASEEVATQIRKHPECMACGGTLEVVQRTNK